MESQAGQTRPRFRYHFPVVLALVVGTAVSVLLFYIARRVEHRRIQSEFDARAENLRIALQNRVNDNVGVLESLGSFYAASKEVDADEFAAFTSSSLNAHEGIYALARAPRVTPGQVEHHLLEAKALNVPEGYRIRKGEGPNGPSTRPVPGPGEAPSIHVTPDGEPVYYPIEFVERRAENRAIWGVDLADSPVLRRAMTEAADDAQAVASEPVELSPWGMPAARDGTDPLLRMDCVVVQPIYVNGTPRQTIAHRRENLQGFVVAFVRLPVLMESSLTALKATAAGAGEIELVAGDQTLYRSPTDDPGRAGRDDMAIRPWRKPLDLAGRHWTIVGRPTERNLADERRSGPWMSLGAGLLFTLLVSAFVQALSGRADRVQQLVAQRTAQLTELNATLREAEAVYESLVETLPQNIFRKDRDGRFTFGNGNFCRELGRTRQEIVGKTDYDFFSGDLAARYRLDDQAVIETGKTFDTVEEHVTPGGSRLYVQVMKTPVRDGDGKVIGVQGIFWDVTDKKLAEQELEKKNRMLQEANEMLRSSVLSERKAYEALKKAQTQLVESEKLAGLGQMVAGVAHEINNPLSFVSNNVVVLQRDLKAVLELLTLYQSGEPALAECRPELMAQVRDLGEQFDLEYTLGNIQELLTRSREGLKRIQQIVLDLRNFARLDQSDLQDADLNAGIESTLNIIHGHAKKKRVSIEKQLSPTLPLVACYPAKVNQVIMNLVVNAIDASREGGKVIVRTTAATVASADGGTSADGDAGRNGDAPAAGDVRVARVEVIDQGTGVDPAVRERIFDPFFTTKPLGQGTGLGLSISYGIVRDHGGTIEVDSVVGEGSTFRVILPVKGPEHKERGRGGDKERGSQGDEESDLREEGQTTGGPRG